MNPMNPYAMKIQWINSSESGFVGFTTFVFLWERIRENVHVVSGLNTKTSCIDGKIRLGFFVSFAGLISD